MGLSLQLWVINVIMNMVIILKIVHAMVIVYSYKSMTRLWYST